MPAGSTGVSLLFQSSVFLGGMLAALKMDVEASDNVVVIAAVVVIIWLGVVTRSEKFILAALGKMAEIVRSWKK